MKIYKYTLPLLAKTTLRMPAMSEILDVQLQGGTLAIWAIVNPLANVEQRQFEIYGTGSDLPEDYKYLMYIATVQDGAFVWHIFERET